MFRDIQQLYYSWKDQEKESREHWDDFVQEYKDTFCGRRHCHWAGFGRYIEAKMWGDDGKICNKIDETGCNGTSMSWSGTSAS